MTITPEKIASRSNIRYVSFPPLPAVLMLPVVAVTGLGMNDVIFTAVWAAVNPVLLFLLLGSLRRRGHSRRSAVDDLWLTAMLGFGSVYFYSSVMGQVWYTAHVVGVTCAIGFTWASIDAARPVLAGLCLGLGFATRTPMAFMFPLFLWEAVRVSGGWSQVRSWFFSREFQRRLLRFAIPAAAVAALIFAHNYARFERVTEFGHTYLNISWAGRIHRWGLFNYHFLARNLAAALVLAPRILAHAPWVQVGQHGMSMLITSPNLAYLVRPKQPSPLAPGLWLAVLATALPSLLYQNSGYVQFGYRFSLDYLIFFVVLLAVGGRPLSRIFKTLVVLATLINLFGAITFDRYSQFTYDDSFFPHGTD
jgi:hypothetical protein